MTTAIEVWVLARLDDGAYQLNLSRETIISQDSPYSSHGVIGDFETELGEKGLNE